MCKLYSSINNIIYYIPENTLGEDKLLNIIYDSKEEISRRNSNSFFERLRLKRRYLKNVEQLFSRIKSIEGRNSKMALKILVKRPFAPINMVGIDAQTGKIFEALYAETEMQRVALSHAYDALKRLQGTNIVPKILQYRSGQDSAFLKTAFPEGSRLSENEMNEDIIEFLISMTQFSMHQFKEENSIGLVSCLSNGAFAPWNTIKDAQGKYHILQWQHADDRPLGYDLLYYLSKPFLDHGDERDLPNMIKYTKWIEQFYSVFGIEDYSQYIDTNAHIYAAQLELEGRYVEANKVRLLNRFAIRHFYEHNKQLKDDILSRPKVLFIMHMPPPVHGASMVGKWIHESDYINSKFDCYYLNLTAANNLADIGKVRIGKIVHLFKLIRTIRSLVKQIKPELVYMTPNAGGMAFVKDSIVVNRLKAMGCHVLAHFHNKGVSQFENNPIYKRLYRKFFDSLKVLLIVPSLYDDNKTFLRIRDLYICANGTPLTLDTEIKAERHHKVIEILFLSNMIISKGVLDLLDALYLLRGQKYKFHCTMIGAETPELTKEKIQEEIDSRHLTELVDYIGPRYGAEKDEYFKKTDIMAFPTYYPKECFPLVILEAMEYKIPIVSTYEAGIPYSVIDGQTGFLCKSQNPIDLSEKLTKLLEDPELRWKMGEEGYKLRMQKFCLETFEQNLAAVLERTINDINNNE